MKNFLKKNLWWIISSIILFIPLACLIYGLSIGTDEKIVIGCILFAVQFLIGAITGIVANRIKKIFFKVLWVIAGFVIDAMFLIISLVFMTFCEPITEEECNDRKESFREMIYNEFDEENHLDKVIGIQLPQYRIVDSECISISVPPTETEYEVELKILFPEGLPKSVWKEITDLAEKEAPNPLSEDRAINRWHFEKDNADAITYHCENESNVGCTVTFKPDCDTVYVNSYKC
jgi:energy-coupling factor transporter transmembrane protein EcfT